MLAGSPTNASQVMRCTVRAHTEIPELENSLLPTTKRPCCFRGDTVWATVPMLWHVCFLREPPHAPSPPRRPPVVSLLAMLEEVVICPCGQLGAHRPHLPLKSPLRRTKQLLPPT